MTDPPNPSEAAAFLGELWPTKPPTAAIQLWEKRTKKTYTFTDAGHAARYGVENAAASDIYVAAGLAASASKPSATRANAASVVGIPGLWGDADVNGGPDNKTNAAPSRAAALELSRKLLEPTLLVGSGYGVQPWWLFEEPWVFSGPDGVAQRERAAQLSRGFNGALRAAAAELEPTWRLDSTYDLARLMRLPGTLNHKGAEPAPVLLLDHEGPRHGFDVFFEIAHDYMIDEAVGGGGVKVDLAGAVDLPIDRILELCQSNPDFAARWNHRSAKHTDGWTASQWDQSITNYLYDAGFTHQEIDAALAFQERKYYPGRTKSSERADYIRLTISKAVAASRKREAKAEAEAERVDVLEQLAEIADAPPSDNGTVDDARERVIALFDRLVRGPKIDGLVQYGRDPTTARFTLVLADGREVPLRDVKGLTQQQTFREKFLVVTGHYPPEVRKSDKQPVAYADIVRALMKAVTIIEHADDTRVRVVLERVASYCDERMSTDRDMACQLCAPFEADDSKTGEPFVHLHLESFVQWLVMRKVRLDEPDLKVDLKAAGFERKGINYQHQTKGRAHRQYWRAPRRLLDREEVAE